jgi:hypothetical protein
MVAADRVCADGIAAAGAAASWSPCRSVQPGGLPPLLRHGRAGQLLRQALQEPWPNAALPKLVSDARRTGIRADAAICRRHKPTQRAGEGVISVERARDWLPKGGGIARADG